MVAHYGSSRGSNKFKDCYIVVLGAILHKTENYYIGKSMAIHNSQGETPKDIEFSNFNRVRRFNDKNIETVNLLDMLVDYSQEIKRSMQRDNSSNIQGKVYVFHNDKILLVILGLKFPGSKVQEWTPRSILEMETLMKKNNKNVQGILNFLMCNTNNEITFNEVRVALELSKQTFSNTLKNPSLKALLAANNIEIRKSGVRKMFAKMA